jgi:hypothetical protein
MDRGAGAWSVAPDPPRSPAPDPRPRSLGLHRFPGDAEHFQRGSAGGGGAGHGEGAATPSCISVGDAEVVPVMVRAQPWLMMMEPWTSSTMLKGLLVRVPTKASRLTKLRIGVGAAGSVLVVKSLATALLPVVALTDEVVHGRDGGAGDGGGGGVGVDGVGEIAGAEGSGDVAHRDVHHGQVFVAAGGVGEGEGAGGALGERGDGDAGDGGHAAVAIAADDGLAVGAAAHLHDEIARLAAGRPWRWSREVGAGRCHRR